MKTNDQSASESLDEDFLKSLRIDTSSTSNGIGVTKVLQTVPIRKPDKSAFVRVHAVHCLDAYMVELKDRQETYILSPLLVEHLLGLAAPVRLRLAVTKQGTVFIWPIKLPREDRRADAWSQSAAEAASLAETAWIRVAADMALGGYQPFMAKGDLAEPKWPEESWPTILKIATRNRLIDDADHPVIRELQGLS